MAEGWISTQAGRHLSGRRKTSTTPEIALRQALHAAGGRFRLHRRLAKGCTPDIVLPGRRLAVFVDGDFWHGCPQHFPQRSVRGPNSGLWAAKFAATKARDQRATALAEDAGWNVVRVWECEVRDSPDGVAAR